MKPSQAHPPSEPNTWGIVTLMPNFGEYTLGSGHPPPSKSDLGKSYLGQGSPWQELLRVSASDPGRAKHRYYFLHQNEEDWGQGVPWTGDR